MDVVEFYTNGFVLVGIIFITAVLSNTVIQAYIHLAIRDGIRAKMALQVKYKKRTLANQVCKHVCLVHVTMSS